MDNRQAIDKLENTWNHEMFDGEIIGLERYSRTEELQSAIDHAIAVMQIPVSEEVQRAITEVETALSEKELIVDGLCGKFSRYHFAIRDLETIIQFIHPCIYQHFNGS